MAEKAEEKDRKADAEGAGSKDGEKLDTILKHLDSLHKRHDATDAKLEALHAAHADMAKRLDALEEGEEGEEEEEREEQTEPTPAAADAAEKGEEHGEESEHESLEAEREENGLKAKDSAEPDSAKRADLDGFEDAHGFHPIRGTKGYKKKKAGDSASSEVRALRAKIEGLEARMREMPEDERSKFVEAQVRAERVYQAHGDAAPRWVSGESLSQYRVRLAQKMKAHSKTWKNVDISKLAPDALEIAETAIYADAWDSAARPTGGSGGVLREITEPDRTGRRISKFLGDPELVWAPFKMPSRHLTGINLKPGSAH